MSGHPPFQPSRAAVVSSQIAALLLVFVVLLTDMYTPMGFAHGMLYAPAILLAMASGQERFVLWAGVISCLFIGLGWYLSPLPPEGYPATAGYIAMNRVLSLSVIAMATGMAIVSLRYARRLDRSRAKAQEQAQQLEIAGELGQLGAWSLDVRNRTVAWSPEVARLHGRPAGHSPGVDEALGYFHPDDRARLRQAVSLCVANRRPFDEEFRMEDASGTTRWVRVAARPVQAPRGPVVRLQGALQDISAYKDVQRRLDESLASWRRLAEAMPMIVWTAAHDGQLTYASPAMGEYSGEDEASAHGDGWAGLIHPEDKPAAIAAWSASVSTGRRYEVEFRLRRRDGIYRWHFARAQRVQLQADLPPVWYGTAIDVHDRLVLEQQARELVTRYETVLESMNDAVIAMDADWRITLVNTRAEETLQRRKDSLLGHHICAEFPEISGSLFEQECERCLREGAVVRFEEAYAPLAKLFEVTAYPAQGGGVTVYFRDVTEQRRVADELRQAQRLESIGQLTGGVAHDFNNLLTVVMGNAELLHILLPKGSTESELADTIFEAGTRGAEMTQRLLAFARKQALSPRTVDLNELIVGLEPLLRRTLGEHIQIDVICSDGLWKALVDPGQLENALLNLAINARDAMPKGGRLVIETANATLDADYAFLNPGVVEGSYVMLAVSDNGHGMSQEVQSRLFEPFFTTKPKGQGTGLGMPMVHGFIKQSNGHVAVYSEVDKGTVVRLYLPRVDGPATSKRALRAEDAPAGRGESVFLVEDDPFVRHYATTLLTGLGYRVVIASNGPDALLKLGEHPEVQLLFTDVVMPGGMNGRELADRVKAINPDLPILFTSGYTDNGIVHQGQLDPGVLLLPKPYRRSELARRVRQAIDQETGPEQPAVQAPAPPGPLSAPGGP